MEQIFCWTKGETLSKFVKIGKCKLVDNFATHISLAGRTNLPIQ